MKYAENKTFVEAEPGEVIEYLSRRKRTTMQFEPKNLQIVSENGIPMLLARNGESSEHPVRKSFCHKLLRWYMFPLNQLLKLSDDTVISICNDYLRKISGKVNVIFDEDDALTITSTRYNDIPDLKLIMLANMLGIESVSKDDFMLRIYGKVIEKKTPVVNDPCGFGFNIISSDTGFRTIYLTHYILRYICTNGAVTATGEKGSKISHVGGDTEQIFQTLENQIENMKSEFSGISAMISRMPRELAAPYAAKIRLHIQGGWGTAFAKSFFKAWDEEAEGSVPKSKYDLYNYITDSAKKHKIVQRFYLEELAGKLMTGKFNERRN